MLREKLWRGDCGGFVARRIARGEVVVLRNVQVICGEIVGKVEEFLVEESVFADGTEEDF